MKKNLLPFFLILLSTTLAFSILTVDHDWGDDWAAYVMQAVSITRGEMREEVARNTFTMRESTRFFGPDAYPWGFPTLLAPFTLICGPLNVFCLKFINLIFFALFLWVFYTLLARRLPPIESALLLAIFAFSPVLLKFADLVQSDLTFLFFSTLGLLLIENAVVRDGNFIGAPRKNIWLGIALFFAFFVRTNGILLAGTLFLTQAFVYLQARPRLSLDWKRILTIGLIPYYVFGLFTLALLLVFPAGEASHFERLFEAFSSSSLTENLSMYFSLPAFFFADAPQASVLYGVLLPFFLGGALLNFKRELHLLVYFILSFALFVIWPEQQGIRFIFPLLPIFVYFAYQGMTATSFALTERYKSLGLWLTRGFWLVIVAIFAWTSLNLARDNLTQGRGPYGNAFDPISLEMFEFVKTDTPDDSVILFYKPRAMRLFTDRDALMIETCDALPKGDYVVLRKSRGAVDQISPADVTSCNPSLSLTEVFDNEKFIIYQISPK